MDERRVALVTGAGGELGRAICQRLADAGHRLALFERDEATAAALRQEMPGDCLVLAADQTDRDEVDQAMEKVRAHFGRLDVAVANAGYAKFTGFLEMDPAVWDRHVAINLSGTFHICQTAARLMAERRSGGSITVISSSLAVRHADQIGAYCVTKSALLMLVQTMAAELGIHRIRANAILPGVIETAMTKWMVGKPGVRRDLLQKTPIGRLGLTEDLAEAVAFLCSDKAGFIGANLSVDGGQSIYGQPAWVRQDRSIPFEPEWAAGLGDEA